MRDEQAHNKETYRKVWILDIQTVRKNYDWEKDWTNRQADEKIDKKCALKDWHKICTDKNKRHQARNKYRTHKKVEKQTGREDGRTEGKKDKETSIEDIWTERKIGRTHRNKIPHTENMDQQKEKRHKMASKKQEQKEVLYI